MSLISPVASQALTTSSSPLSDRGEPLSSSLERKTVLTWSTGRTVHGVRDFFSYLGYLLSFGCFRSQPADAAIKDRTAIQVEGRAAVAPHLAKGETKTLQERYDTMAEQMQVQDNRLEQVEKENNELKRLNEQLESDCIAITEEKTQLENNNSHLNSQNKQLDDSNKRQKDQVDELSKQNQQKDNLIAEHKANALRLKSETAQLRTEKDSAITELKQNIQAKERELSQNRQDLNSYETDKELLLQDITTKDAAIAALNRRTASDFPVTKLAKLYIPAKLDQDDRIDYFLTKLIADIFDETSANYELESQNPHGRLMPIDTTNNAAKSDDGGIIILPVVAASRAHSDLTAAIGRAKMPPVTMARTIILMLNKVPPHQFTGHRVQSKDRTALTPIADVCMAMIDFDYDNYWLLNSAANQNSRDQLSELILQRSRMLQLAEPAKQHDAYTGRIFDSTMHPNPVKRGERVRFAQQAAAPLPSVNQGPAPDVVQ